jgi:hypothetical protein
MISLMDSLKLEAIVVQCLLFWQNKLHHTSTIASLRVSTDFLVGMRHLKLLEGSLGDGWSNIGYASFTFEMSLQLLTVQQLKHFLKFCVK